MVLGRWQPVVEISQMVSGRCERVLKKVSDGFKKV